MTTDDLVEQVAAAVAPGRARFVVTVYYALAEAAVRALDVPCSWCDASGYHAYNTHKWAPREPLADRVAAFVAARDAARKELDR